MKGLLLVVIISIMFFSGCGEKNVVTKSNEETNLVKNPIEEYKSIINKYESEYDNLKYDLIYFDNDNIPELVVDNSSYWLSMYSYKGDKMYPLMDKWSYGAAGNVGYDYAEKKGIIYNFNQDYAGAVANVSYMVLNDKFEFDIFTHTFQGAELEETDEMYNEIKEYIEITSGYYLNGERITEEEFYNSIKGADKIEDYKILYGTKSINEITEELESR